LPVSAQTLFLLYDKLKVNKVKIHRNFYDRN